MPSPIGHLIAGYAAYSVQDKRFRSKYVLVGALFSAIAADLDFFPGIVLGDPDRFHHGVTHSVGAACFYGIAVWAGLRYWRVSRAPILALLFVGAYTSHLVLDFFSVDTSDPQGSPLLWPLVNTYYIAPVPLFLDVQRRHGGIWELLRGLFSSHNFLAVLREVVVLIPLVVWGQRRGAEKPSTLSHASSFGIPIGVDSRVQNSSKETGQ